MWVCIWRCNSFYIRMLSLLRSKRRIEIKTSFSSWTKHWNPTFGDDTLTEMSNLQIFKSVQLYIKLPKLSTHLWSHFYLKSISSRCFHFTYKYGIKVLTGRGLVLAIFYVFYPIFLRSRGETFVSPHYYFAWPITIYLRNKFS